MNAWVDARTFNLWHEKIWFRRYGFRKIPDSILYMDSAPSHLTQEIFDKFDYYNSQTTLVPPGLTSYCQPLDLCINKPFKDLSKKNTENFY